MLLGGIIIIYYYIYNVLRPNLSGRRIKDSGGREVTGDPVTDGGYLQPLIIKLIIYLGQEG